MATPNEGRWFAAQYEEAMRKYGSPTERQESLKDLQVLLDDRALPRMLRITCNLVLADGVDDWYQAESLVKDAEAAWRDLKERTPEDGDEPGGVYAARTMQLDRLWKTLESLKASHAEDDPKNPKWVAMAAAERAAKAATAHENQGKVNVGEKAKAVGS
ncbi:hypothetical protein B0A48_07062 [Cryoendolithus antarcticus]|uniref:Uncharacterized protein n=1 Tax=Cryoendolithus antarcticus TaxID=1507870 RepID=A0A1V8T7J0_9PEZI|nr:hypothetical protein B0A48_07062 [Cryoendolithus antarcticus]